MKLGRAMRGWLPLLAAALLLAGRGSSPAAGALDCSRPPHDLIARGSHGVVVTAEPHATAIGLAILQAGGNAVDAAVGVALALAVTHPQAGNLGGGGFLVLRTADGGVHSLDFRERAPRSATPDMYLRADGSVDEQKVQFGASAAGVPGSPAGLLHALQKWGTRSLAQVAAPAIRLAREGFEVDHFLADALASEREALGRYPSTRAVFFRDDAPLQQGDVLVQQDLAATLERFAEHGLDGFYAGRTAELLVAQMQQGGGFVSKEDLAGYAPREREPLRGRYRDVEVITMGPPSSGGVALLQMLNLLAPRDVAGIGFGNSASIHLLSEVMRRAYADRSRWLGDPDYYQVPVEGLIGAEYAKTLGASIDLEHKSAVQPGVPPGSKESDDTTHFSIVDQHGNAVACTTTINSTFGAMLVVDGAGFLLNNEMDDFSAKPGVPNQFGLVGGKANAIAPQKRMLSSMTPTIVLRDNQLRMVLGAPGGGRIITAVLQVVLNCVDHGMSLERAVQAPRVHHQWLPDEILWETFAMPSDVRRALEAKGHALAKRPRGIAQVFAIEIGAAAMIGVADHRSGGSAAAY